MKNATEKILLRQKKTEKQIHILNSTIILLLCSVSSTDILTVCEVKQILLFFFSTSINLQFNSACYK